MMKGNESISTNPTTNRLYSNSIYQSQMFKILGNIDLNGSKVDIDKESVKSGDNNKQSSGNKKDVTSIPSTNTSNSKDEK